jgi:hypothetical protein
MLSFFKNPTVQIVMGYFPKPSTILFAMITFALGMVWAYAIAPVQYVNGEPAQLQQSFQDQWVLGAAGRYANRNANTDANIVALLSLVDDPAGIANRLRQIPPEDPNYTPDIQFLNDPGLQPLVDTAQAEAAPPPPRPNAINNYVMPIVTILVFTFLFIIGKALWTLLIWPFIEPVWARIFGGREQVDAKEEIGRIKKQRALEQEMREATVDTSRYGDPIIRKASLYQAGRGNYDDSFNIETDAGMYYGETGASIAEKIGEDGVTAIEVWMFDKDEFTNTPAAIFATEYAFNDPVLRSRLEPRGEIVKMETGAKIVLETAALYVEAVVKDLEYDSSEEQPNSVLSNSTVQMIAWAKSGAPGGGSAAPVPPMPAAPDSFDPAPMPPAGGQGQTPLAPPPIDPSAFQQQFGGAPPPPVSPPAGGQTPLAPPPMGSPGGDNLPGTPDDPFAGAGDFTPINPNQ